MCFRAFQNLQVGFSKLRALLVVYIFMLGKGILGGFYDVHVNTNWDFYFCLL